MPHKIAKLLKLDKPLIIFDLETTGLSIFIDRIVEIAYLKIMPNGAVFKGDFLINPEMEIPEESIEVHGITNNDVSGALTFKQKAADLWDVFHDCYYGGFNVIYFDLPMIRREFIRAGIDFEYDMMQIIDSKRIYQYMEPRTLSGAYKYYCNKEHKYAHNALSDVEVTAEIFNKQLEKYKEVRDLDFVQKIHAEASGIYVDNERKFYWRYGKAHFAFSKYRDEPLEKIAKIDPGFLHWILSADFSTRIKEIIEGALKGEFPKKKKGKKKK